MSFLLHLLSMAAAAPPKDLVNPEAYTEFSLPYRGDMYSGYLHVENDLKQLHYLFYPSVERADRLVLWLNGGPGCSSLTGAFVENGPFVFIGGTDKLVENQYAWTKLAHMLYIEAPAGVGFSFGDETTDDHISAKDNLSALLNFFNKFPELRGIEFYIAGESYAGIYIPNLASEILEYNLRNPAGAINIKGIMVGNGCTDPTECTSEAAKFPYFKFEFLHNHNFLSHKLFLEVQRQRERCFGSDSQECEDLYDKVVEETNKAGTFEYNPYNVYGVCYKPPILDGEAIEPMAEPPERIEQFSGHIPPCSDAIGLYTYLRNKDFRNYLNILPQSKEWEKCQSLKYTKDPRATYYLYEKLISANLRILIFSGDVDGVVPITGTLNWINKLQVELSLPTFQRWRPWFKSEKQNAGNVMIIEGLWFVSIRNAGHMVPADQREAAYIMASSFLSDHFLPYD